MQWSTVFLLFALLGGLSVLRLVLIVRKRLADINYLTGDRTIVGPTGLAPLVPRIPYISVGPHHLWEGKHDIFARAGWDVYSSIELLPKIRTALLLADAEAIKEMTQNRARFRKPMELYKVLAVWGSNIVVSEDEEWKKHRKTANPAFTERNLRLVWQESIDVMLDLFKGSWRTQSEVCVNDVSKEVTMVAALNVISAAAFGKRISWQGEASVPPGHTMRFKEVMDIVAGDILTRLFVPMWAKNFTAKTRRVFAGFDELTLYMQEMIDERKLEKAGEYNDLFSNLVAASDEEADPRAKLTDQELISDVYMFLLAGHETSGHTLGFALHLLALYQAEQELLFQHIRSVVPEGNLPTQEDLPRLTRVTAVLHETLRLFPSANGIPKISAEDTTLTVGGSLGRKLTVPVPKGTFLFIDTPGLHYNPRYWENPTEFKPDRFLAPDWPRDAFMPFSAGSRSCIGRRFFETSAAAILTMLLLHYKIELVEEPQYAHETPEERRERVLAASPGITITPHAIPMTFKKR